MCLKAATKYQITNNLGCYYKVIRLLNDFRFLAMFRLDIYELGNYYLSSRAGYDFTVDERTFGNVFTGFHMFETLADAQVYKTAYDSRLGLPLGIIQVEASPKNIICHGITTDITTDWTTIFPTTISDVIKIVRLVGE